jgi:hypothetical protein
MKNNFASFGVWIMLLVGLASEAARCDDIVVVRGTKRFQPHVEKRGQVVDYTGEGVTFLVGEHSTLIPPDQIVEIRSTWSKGEIAGDAFHAQGKLAAALEAYRSAKEEEKRPWCVRKIQVKLAACYEWNEQVELAGEEILSLLKNDKQSPYFYALPLSWQNGAPHAVLAEKAKRWMQERGNPAANLLGASWLLAGEERTAALNMLLQLGSDLDPQIAPLAVAQQWRTKLVTASLDDITRWQQLVERMTPEIRGGPQLLLGAAYARHKQWNEVALCPLQTALLTPQRETLVAAGFIAAANQLESQQQISHTIRLYRELQSVNPVAAQIYNVSEKLAALEKISTAQPSEMKRSSP